jgi:hypothetical protein
MDAQIILASKESKKLLYSRTGSPLGAQLAKDFGPTDEAIRYFHLSGKKVQRELPLAHGLSAVNELMWTERFRDLPLAPIMMIVVGASVGLLAQLSLGYLSGLMLACLVLASSKVVLTCSTCTSPTVNFRFLDSLEVNEVTYLYVSLEPPDQLRAWTKVPKVEQVSGTPQVLIRSSSNSTIHVIDGFSADPDWLSLLSKRLLAAKENK